MIFEQFRVSLLERDQSLFDFLVRQPNIAAAGNPREYWLRDTFSREIAFTHRRQRFHYVPDPDYPGGLNGIVVGRVGRKRSAKENEPPESGMRETERQAWHAAFLLLDPRAHEDGQKVAIQRDASVAQAFPLLKSLLHSINGRDPHEMFLAQAEPLSEEYSFWHWVSEHKEVTRLTFNMIAPNMFGLHDDWDADMRELKRTENADRAKLQTESDDGLIVDTPRVRKGVEHVARGTGSLTARAKDGAPFSSQDSVKTVQTPDKTEEISWGQLLKVIVARIFKM